MSDIKIKRGYEVLPDNNIRFGIRVVNNSDFAISDVEVILDYSESLFEMQGNKIEKLGTIPPTVPRTAKFILKPLGCIHKENIGATIIFKDHQWKKHTLEMRPKEVHCVCPFLKEKSITRAEFLTLSNSGYFGERGMNFDGISNDKLVDFLTHTCKNRLYKVDEFPIEGGRILYLAGDALGEKAYYLLTAIIKEYEELTQILLCANSDKSYGLNGFLNEIFDNLRHLVQSTSAREIGIIKKEQVINIIDSVVQRTTFSTGEGAARINIKDSVVQRTTIKDDREREKQEKLHREEDERRGKERKTARDEEERLRKQREEHEHVARELKPLKWKGTSRRGFFAVVLVLGMLLLGYWALATDSPTSKPVSSVDQKTITNSIGTEFVLISAGEFDMGSPPNEAGRNHERPIHRVKISNAFYMSKYEVTQKQWYDVMDINPSYFEGDNLPVEQVSWNDAQEFIRRLNVKEGTNKYRLPSEAEWEYAARAGTKTRYSFGDDSLELDEYAWYGSNSGSVTHKVGQKNPNPWGLYDMHGNVMEWVQDIYHSSYDGAPANGSAWEGDDSDRVFRGGCVGYGAGCMRSGYRDRSTPDYRHVRLGFRYCY